uniref:DDE Tnp4 domain-containing protein n=1 Tax=Bionectria ochroleuca TaxID=29856 RepID=A0A8H7K650_BIOOC
MDRPTLPVASSREVEETVYIQNRDPRLTKVLAALVTCCLLRIRRLKRLRQRYLNRKVINPGGPFAALSKAEAEIRGHAGAFEHEYRMKPRYFQALVSWLEENTDLAETRYQTVELKVLVILYVLGQGCTQRAAARRFGIAQSTVSDIMKKGLEALRLLFLEFVKQPDDNYIPASTIINTNLQHYHGCIGAIDGTYIRVYIPIAKQKKWWNRKSQVSQNVLYAVNQEGIFTYVLAGAEGSVNDALLYQHTVSKSLRIPIQYYIIEFSNGSTGPQNTKELYNRRHTTLRMIVEQTFGGTKKKFRILRSTPPEHPIKGQILIEDKEVEIDEADLDEVCQWVNENVDVSDSRKLRDIIVTAQWEEYLKKKGSRIQC